MIVLGLGANLGDRLAQLRLAFHHIQKIEKLTVKQVSPIYISDALLPEGAAENWDRPYLNLALLCECTLSPFDLLTELKKIESLIGRKPERRHWGPRHIDIDILAWNKEIIKNEMLNIPHESLIERPFALWPLADVDPFWTYPLPGKYLGKTAAEMVEQWGSRFDGNAPFHTKQINQRLDTPQLVGILNVTPNSFSDGGQFFQAELAQQKALSLMQDGAEIIDIGAESTAPLSQPIDAKTEWARLSPVLDALIATKNAFIFQPKISIDTYHVETAEKALAKGVDWINDVTGLKDPAMCRLIAEAKTDCIMMHHLSIPASRNVVLPRDQNGVELVLDWAEKKLTSLEQMGIQREKIIFDPGIGFGKVPEQSLEIIKHANVFKQLGTRSLIGHSRKSFLSLFTQEPFAERDIETLAMTLFLAKQDVDYLRVHHVAMSTRAQRVMGALMSASSPRSPYEKNQK